MRIGPPHTPSTLSALPNISPIGCHQHAHRQRRRVQPADALHAQRGRRDLPTDARGGQEGGAHGHRRGPHQVAEVAQGEAGDLVV